MHPIRQRLHHYYRLTRLDKPIGTLLLLWPTLWALWIAGEGSPSPKVVVVFVVGVALMRAAGCVINDYADRNIDGHVKRTRERPLATGAVTPREALTLFGVLCAAAFALVLTMNTLTIALSFVGAGLAALYPFTKRYTHLPQLFLGAAFGWATPMAFAAETGSVPPLAWLLFIATVIWAVIYDTMYAMVDRDDDLRIGVKSTAILFGEADRLIIALLQLLMLADLLLVGMRAGMGVPYHLGVAMAAALMGYHQYLIRERLRPACFKAFLHNNWLGMALFIAIVADYAGRRPVFFN